jgi:hypothetical protein
MAKRGHRTTLDRILLAITALFVLAGFMALGLLKNATQENRALMILVSSLGMLGGLMALMFVSAFWIRLRRWTWQRAMASWQRRYQMGGTPKSVLPDHLTESKLRYLAIQTYSRIGYRLANRREGEIYLRLINPEGQIELVACNQQSGSVALHQVYPLELEMKRVKAVRGFFWAPGGFTDESIAWVVHKPIVLADRVEIRRLIDCAQTKGSRLLEEG